MVAAIECDDLLANYELDLLLGIEATRAHCDVVIIRGPEKIRLRQGRPMVGLICLVSKNDDSAGITHLSQRRPYLETGQTCTADDNTVRGAHEICLGGMLRATPSDLRALRSSSPRPRPMISFMISVVPAKIRITRASQNRRAMRYSSIYPAPPCSWTQASTTLPASSVASSLAS